MAKETGLVCTGESVRAILDGRKTQTRRVIKMPPGIVAKYEYKGNDGGNELLPKESGHYWMNGYAIWRPNLCPYGQVGDRLWCKEAFNDCDGIHYCKPRYKATDENYPTAKWKSSRFMFKKYARIWLEITGIRVERVQEISIQDLRAEGMQFGCAAINQGFLQFRNLWNSINAKRGYPWSDEDLPDNLKTGKDRIMYGNPWVWVLEVKRISDGN